MAQGSMLPPFRLFVLYLGAFLSAVLHHGLHAQEPDSSAGEVAVLFTSHGLLNLTIEAPLRSIFRERDQESEDHDATLRIAEPDGADVVLNIGLKTRGKFRLQRSTCGFPPLRLNIRTRQAENTIFTGQDKLKLVTPLPRRPFAKRAARFAGVPGLSSLQFAFRSELPGTTRTHHIRGHRGGP